MSAPTSSITFGGSTAASAGYPGWLELVRLVVIVSGLVGGAEASRLEQVERTQRAMAHRANFVGGLDYGGHAFSASRHQDRRAEWISGRSGVAFDLVVGEADDSVQPSVTYDLGPRRES